MTTVSARDKVRAALGNPTFEWRMAVEPDVPSEGHASMSGPPPGGYRPWGEPGPTTRRARGLPEDRRVPLPVPEIDLSAAQEHMAAGPAPAPWTGNTCDQCGGMMIRTGSCETCVACGSNTGCG